jgi:hypothetical protein
MQGKKGRGLVLKAKRRGSKVRPTQDKRKGRGLIEKRGPRVRKEGPRVRKEAKGFNDSPKRRPRIRKGGPR